MTYYWMIESGDFILYEDDKETVVGTEAEVGNFRHSPRTPPEPALRILDTQTPDQRVLPVGGYNAEA